MSLNLRRETSNLALRAYDSNYDSSASPACIFSENPPKATNAELPARMCEPKQLQPKLQNRSKLTRPKLELVSEQPPRCEKKKSKQDSDDDLLALCCQQNHTFFQRVLADMAAGTPSHSRCPEGHALRKPFLGEAEAFCLNCDGDLHGRPMIACTVPGCFTCGGICCWFKLHGLPVPPQT